VDERLLEYLTQYIEIFLFIFLAACPILPPAPPAFYIKDDKYFGFITTHLIAA
jgi:hypothetical protein